ncbi:hypothetical protein [Ancylobacter oerskovii]|uniref:Uncharacterized protein n=1 Tax=Ancylobacter oerskovii TaxID=459519 RepID=A0ABW4Z6F4_9HYPH|nr:hypothetical protein [Ancylobacter oerskovii]MBS7544306.1 hypothetical protein [Ancylobacter oerskovii]
MNMEIFPYRIVQRRITLEGERWTLSPQHSSSEAKSWAAWSVFVPTGCSATKQTARKLALRYTLDYIPYEDGVFVIGAYRDLTEVVKALKPRKSPARLFGGIGPQVIVGQYSR